MKKYLETGKIVGTHGVRGTLRVQPWCDSPEFLKKFKKIYTDSKGLTSLSVTAVKAHGNIVLMDIKGIETIEAAEGLRNKIIYIDRNDVKLEEGRYFIDDLIGCAVTDADSGASLGTLCEVSATGANDIWHIERDGRQYLVPAIDEVIVSVDVEAKSIVLRPLKGIFDDEN